MFIGFIYVVTNTVNGKVYVGKTVKPFDARWKNHKEQARCKSSFYFHNAIRKHGADAFTFEIVDMAFSEDALNEKECERIRRESSAEKAFGYNLTLGGEGGVPNEATLNKIRQKWTDQKYRAAVIGATRTRCADPEYRRRQSRSGTVAFSGEEVRKRKSEDAKNLWSDATFRARRAEAFARPETKQRMSEAASIRLASNPEQKARMLEAAKRPEVVRRRGAAIRESHARPEVKQRLSQATRTLWANPVWRQKVLEARRVARAAKAA